ncbi:MAG TPA: glycosyltransferase family 1 protein [Acidimicrobiia bacterium]|nr:glycosyltransferase family 1 protein [Acidimicrobiia bacterium]
MRVLLDVSAVPSDPRGAGRYVSELARHVVTGATPDLEVVLLARRDDAARWRAVAADASDVEVVVHPVVPGPRPVRLVWEQVAGPRLARRLALDVWHGPHYTVPLRAALPRVVTVHDLTLLEHPEWHERPKALYFGRMIPAAVKHAAVSVCVSRHTADRLAAVVPAAAGARARDVVVIPHGVDHDRFRPVSDPALDLATLGRFGVCAPYLAFLGTIEPRKDVASLVHAFAAVAPEHPDLQLVLAGGGGWHDGAVDAAIAASGVAERVVRTGYLPDDVVPALLRRAAAVVYPSLEEGFGLPALEALACGAPLVTTGGSSIEEFVGDAALLVAPGDTDALVAALRRVLVPHEASALAARGPAQAAPYTWRAAADRHVDAYRRAAASRSS